MYRAQTCAHSGIEPSTLAKGFPQGGPKNSKKNRFFDHFGNLRPYISATVINRGIQAAYGKMLYPSPIQLSHVYGPIAHGVLQGGPKSEGRNTSFGHCESSTVSVFVSVVKCGRVCREQTYAHSGVEPSMQVGQGVSTGWAKKIRIFDHLQILRISATAKNRAMHTSSVRTF